MIKNTFTNKNNKKKVDSFFLKKIIYCHFESDLANRITFYCMMKKIESRGYC